MTFFDIFTMLKVLDKGNDVIGFPLVILWLVIFFLTYDITSLHKCISVLFTSLYWSSTLMICIIVWVVFYVTDFILVYL